MPLEAVGAFILRPVLELLLEVFGYLTGRVVVPLFTFGLFRVERLAEDRKQRRARRRSGRGAGPAEPAEQARVLGADWGTLVGLLFWALVIVGLYLLYRALP